MKINVTEIVFVAYVFFHKLQIKRCNFLFIHALLIYTKQVQIHVFGAPYASGIRSIVYLQIKYLGQTFLKIFI
jgi:hypothetical protein